MLFGSSILPSVMYIDGEAIQLGTIVGRAHKESGLTVERWNALPELDREAKLAAMIYKMRVEARNG
jgi:hypothetical protein